MQDEDVARAFHESGHCIAAWRLGAEIRAATILPGGDHHGIVSVFLGPQLVGPSSVIFQLAGGIAERVAFPDSDWRAHSEADLAAVEKTFGDPEHPDRPRLQRMAARLIEENWRAVEATAHMLLERGTLDGALLEAALDETFGVVSCDAQGATTLPANRWRASGPQRSARRSFLLPPSSGF